MIINHLNNLKEEKNFSKNIDYNFKYNLLEKDENFREINIYLLNKCIVTGNNLFYPNNLIFSEKDNSIYRPIEETTMSLKDLKYSNTFKFSPKKIINQESTPVFYFIYNTDNYYHFIYDSLPYLLTYFFLKEKILDLKLLINYPNFNKKENYKFFNEFLDILSINNNDILFVKENTVYNKIYISSSYTHGHNSNLPPRKEIYDLYDKICFKIKNNNNNLNKNFPKKIYISRRTWLHNDFSNIGTNYTNRRKMMNENELVEKLKENNFEEIFTENLSTQDKILLFMNAEIIVGAIGGGMCNLLFANKVAKSITICSPGFLSVNERFKFSLNKCNNVLLNNNFHYSNEKYKKFMRVKDKKSKIVGEIIEVNNENVLINYSKNNISGWNSEINFDKKIINKEDLILLDKGLNSEWICNIDEVNNIIKNYNLNNTSCREKNI